MKTAATPTAISKAEGISATSQIFASSPVLVGW